jgi:hypothetical protein
VRLELESPARSSTTHHSARTGADGIANFAGLERDAALTADDLRLRASVAGLFSPAVEASFPAQPWPVEPLELVVPVHAALVVAVLDENGAPLAGSGRDVELRLARELQPGAQIWRERSRLSARLEEGLARFEPVGLGLGLTASYDDRPTHAPAQLEFDGPTRAGEELRVELRLGAPLGVLRLRVLAPDRTPLASVTVEAGLRRVIGGGSFSTSEPRQTDAEGQLSVPLTEPWSEGEKRALTLVHRPGAGPEQEAEVDLSRALTPAEHELGDIVLAERPVLVSGRVVDVAGRGVADVQLAVERGWSEEENGELSWSSMAWGNAQPDGSFAFYDEAPEASLRVTLESDTYEPVAPLEFTPGTRGLEFVVRPGVNLRGSVRLAAGVPPEGIAVSARGSDGEARGTRVETSGEFEIQGLAPGTYDVEFELAPTDERLLTIPAVVAHAGDERDPRLVDVDLSGLARVVTLGVRTADGSPAPGGWARVLGLESGEDVAFVIEAGTATLLVPFGGADVELNVPGHRLLTLLDLEADREVRLEPAFHVRCELAAHVLLPEGGELQLRLVPVSVDGYSSAHYTLYRGHEQAGWYSTAFGGTANTFGNDRRALDMEVQAPGTYEVVFHLVRGNPQGGRISFTVQAAEEHRQLALDERSSATTFVIEPDPDEYASQLAGK